MSMRGFSFRGKWVFIEIFLSNAWKYVIQFCIFVSETYQMKKEQRIVKTYRVRETIYKKAAKKAEKKNTTLAKQIEEFLNEQANEKREN